MPRSKTGKKRQNPIKEDIEAARDQVINNGMSTRAAAITFNVKRTTLMRYISKCRNTGENLEYDPKCDVQKVFTEKDERSLVDYLKQAASLHYGLSLNEVRLLAFQYAEAAGINYPDTWKRDGKAGHQWLRSFRNRYKNDLSLRKPEATSLARSTGFNRATVASFFSNYKDVLSRYNFAPSNIWNCDETGITTVHVPPKVLAPKGIKQIGSMTSGERGQNVTMIAAVNAIGNSIPPMLIFPRVHFKQFMLIGSPSETTGGASPSGWSNEKLFIQFMEHFIEKVKPSVEKPVILLMDNHESHISIPVINLAKTNGVILITFHPHTSHKMQPLDRSVFGPFKTFYNTALNEWMINPGNAGKPATIYNVSEFVGKAYPKAFTPSNIISGFRVAGIFPVNENIFTDDEYLAASVTDRPLPDVNEAEQLDQVGSSNATVPRSPPRTPPISSVVSLLSPTTLQDVRPFPKATERKATAPKKRKGKSVILTDTPNKEEIEAMKTKKKVISTTKKARVTRALCGSSSDTEEEVPIEESDSDTNFDLEVESREQQTEVDFEQENISIEDFVLIKIEGKKMVKYYVAEIKEIDADVISVQYLMRLKTKYPDSFKFIKDDERTYEASMSQVVLKLPRPTVAGGSIRQQSAFIFSVDFSAYQLD